MDNLVINELPAKRQTSIYNYIISNGSASIKHLAALFNVSEATIRRDLDALDHDKMIERIHGGAIALKQNTSFEFAYAEKAMTRVEEKWRIGKCGADYVDDGDTILLDAGTTAIKMAHNLTSKRNITVITYDLHIANEISLDPSSTLIVTGGSSRHGFGVLTGSMILDFLPRICVDKSFLTADAIDIDFGVSNATTEEADIKRLLIQSGRKVFLLADHSKFGRRALMQVCPLSDIDLTITDSALTEEMRHSLSAANCEFVTV